MNTGIIASRYAAALLKLVDETGGGETVVRQARVMRKALERLPELRRAIADSTAVSAEQKIALFETVIRENVILNEAKDLSLAPELRKLLELLVRNGRIGDISLVLSSFENQYYESRGIVRGVLTLCSAEDSVARDLQAKITRQIETRTGKHLLLETKVDESLIGGFMLEVEDRLLDASVSRQLDLIRRRFVEKNRRIV